MHRSDAEVSARLDTIYGVLFVFAFAALLFSLLLGLYGIYAVPQFDHKAFEQPIASWPFYKQLEVFTLMAWGIGPPVVFWCEFFWLYQPSREYKLKQKPPLDWEMFKYSQDVSAKVWIAVATALAILYFGKDIKP